MTRVERKVLKVKWFGVQLPMMKGVPAIAKLCTVRGGTEIILECEAKNPLEAFYGLRWELQKVYGITQGAATRLLLPCNILPAEDIPDADVEDNVPPF